MAIGVKKFAAIVDDMSSWIIANQDKITDFNEGSVIRSFVEAVAKEVEGLYLKTKIGFIKSLIEIPGFVFGVEREDEQYAIGEIQYSRSGTSGVITVPIDSIATTEDGIRFKTTEIGTIANGNNDSNLIDAKAISSGKESNVLADTITVMETSIPGAETVTNPSEFTGGLDAENDTEYTERFQQYIEGLGVCNKSGIKAMAKSITSVRSASIVEHFPPVASYNFTVYIEDGYGNASDTMITEVEEKLLGDGTEGNEGVKAAGINIRVLAPTKVTQAVTVEITDDGILSQALIQYNVEKAISDYFERLELGDDIVRGMLIRAILGANGAVDADLTLPAANVTIGAAQIASLGVITVTFA